MRHPDWAAAYILVDWKKRGRNAVSGVAAAYEDYERHVGEPTEDTAKRILDERLDKAIAKMEVYVQALKDARDRAA